MATLRESTDGSSRSVEREGDTGSKTRVKRGRTLEEWTALVDGGYYTVSPEAYDKILEMIESPPCPDRVARIRKLFAKKAPWE